MALSKDQAQFYERTLEVTRKQIEDLNAQIEEELSRVRARLEQLKSDKDAAKQIYDGACRMLGIENDLDSNDETAG